MLFLHFISSFEGTPLKICKIPPPDLLFLVIFIGFYISRYHFSQKSGKCEMGKKIQKFGKIYKNGGHKFYVYYVCLQTTITLTFFRSTGVFLGSVSVWL